MSRSAQSSLKASVVTAFRRVILWLGLYYLSAILAGFVSSFAFKVEDFQTVLVIETVVSLPAMIIMLVWVYRLMFLIGSDAPWGWVLVFLFPCVNVIALFMLNVKASNWCRRQGIPVGFFGPTLHLASKTQQSSANPPAVLSSQPVKRVSKAWYLGLMVAGGGWIILVSVLAGATGTEDPIGPAIIGSIGFLLYVVAFYSLAWQAWAALCEDQEAIKPAEVLLLLIPFYQFYWVFRAIQPLGRAINRYANRHQLSIVNANEKIFTLFCWAYIAGILCPPASLLYMITGVIIALKLIEVINAIADENTSAAPVVSANIAPASPGAPPATVSIPLAPTSHVVSSQHPKPNSPTTEESKQSPSPVPTLPKSPTPTEPMKRTPQDFIARARAKGMSDEDIIALFIKQGWPEEKIKKLL